MALTLFVASASRETLDNVTFEKPDPIVISQGLVKLQQLSLITQQQQRYSLAALTREYAWAELVANAEFAQQLRQRWVDWYLKFSESFGNVDWKEWNTKYENFEVEWENLQAVFEWCIANNRYSDVKTFWNYIKEYIFIRGYWDEHLEWSGWLIEAAKKENDYATAVLAMCDRAVTLVRIRQLPQLQEAQQILKESWDLRHHQTASFELKLAANMAILHLHLGDLQQAQKWLEV
ncbi:MAG: RNA polymerase subunit sigma-24, partial [Cyanobacteria bacterium J06632_19]